MYHRCILAFAMDRNQTAPWEKGRIMNIELIITIWSTGDAANETKINTHVRHAWAFMKSGLRQCYNHHSNQ